MRRLPQSPVIQAYENIRLILEEARSHAYRAVNFAMVTAYWNIGKVIVEEEQKGKTRAEYGRFLLTELSMRLTKDYGKGFNQTNLIYMREFYLKFKIYHALRDELTWTHYRLLLKIENENARNFYMIETINNRWSTRDLDRQIDSLLYERLALSRDKKKVKELSAKGQIVRNPEDVIKDPYVLEFLGIKENEKHAESSMESLLIEKLKAFLLELGKGFSFIARQKRISVGGDDFYIDLVFYNHLLKCFVLIDLKSGKLTHQDIGQMDFYVRYYENEEKGEGDNSTIGLILCSSKNESMAKYTLLEESRQVFASKYKFCLPTEAELKKAISEERQMIELEKKLERMKRET